MGAGEWRIPTALEEEEPGDEGGGRWESETIVPVAFMPGSTPMFEKVSRSNRILAWNLVGAVLSFLEQTHDVMEIDVDTIPPQYRSFHSCEFTSSTFLISLFSWFSSFHYEDCAFRFLSLLTLHSSYISRYSMWRAPISR